LTGAQLDPMPVNMRPAAHPAAVESVHPPSLQHAPCPHSVAVHAEPEPWNTLPAAQAPVVTLTHVPVVVSQQAPVVAGLTDSVKFPSVLEGKYSATRITYIAPASNRTAASVERNPQASSLHPPDIWFAPDVGQPLWIETTVSMGSELAQRLKLQNPVTIGVKRK
jgi:hypothetical protein